MMLQRITRTHWLFNIYVGLWGALLVVTACSVQPIASKSVSHRSDPSLVKESITLICGEGAQFELIGPQGQRVFIDVTDPSILSRPPKAEDILLTTHFHNDHFNKDFTDRFPGRQLLVRQGAFGLPNLSIRGIASQHSEHDWDEPKPSGGSNYIYVIEMAGIRFAHFGDIGQKRLNNAQLNALGRVDVAITQFVNPYSHMNMENQKGFSLMAQIQPRIIIPHHGVDNEAAIGLATSRWRVRYAPENLIMLSFGMLPDQTMVLLMGEMTGYLQKTLNLKKWP